MSKYKTTNCNTLQHTATHCNTLGWATLYTDMHTYSQKSGRYSIVDIQRLHTATHCNTLQHTATHCNTLQHTATHCSWRQRDTSELPRIRQEPATWLTNMYIHMHILKRQLAILFSTYKDDTQRRHKDDTQRRHKDEKQRPHKDDTQRRHKDDTQRRHKDDTQRRHKDTKTQRWHTKTTQRRHKDDTKTTLIFVCKRQQTTHKDDTKTTQLSFGDLTLWNIHTESYFQTSAGYSIERMNPLQMLHNEIKKKRVRGTNSN